MTRPRTRLLPAALAALALLSPAPAPAAPAEKPAAQRLAGTLTEVADLWTGWKSRHLRPDGRVVDDANGGISHSEGQGYGLVLAVAAGDRESFARIWAWTRRNLLVRADDLPAWRWDPAAKPPVADLNDASDGTILIAWGLAEAGLAWDEPAYRANARRLLRALAADIAPGPDGSPLLMPATAGFGAADRPDGPVVNLSYWVFPALPVLAEIEPGFPAEALTLSGLALVEAARFGPAALPSDWIALKGAPAPAAGFPPQHGYNALRVPLHLAWSRRGARHLLAPFRLLADRPPAVIDVTDGRAVEPLAEPGYAAIPALVACALEGERLPDTLRRPAPQAYYPATLGLLAVVAIRQRYPECW